MEMVVICDNIRSTHNMGSILRTCDGLGVGEVYACGVTPYPRVEHDIRLPHIIEKLTKQIHKTALGAEKTIKITPLESTENAISLLRSQGYQILAVEQSKNAVLLDKPYTIKPNNRCAVILGAEVEGVSATIIKQCDMLLEIPMVGQKESYNVSVAASIVLYYLRYMVQ